MSNYQTLSEFLSLPFGNKLPIVNEYDKSYQELRMKQKISVGGYTKLDDTYYLHIKIGSVSNGGIEYDVVIQFFTDDPVIKKEKTLANYKIQFFSNSPSFIYKYAALYKLHGYLIDALYDKMDKEYMDKLPEKTNPDMKLMWDKSIYYACRYIMENKFMLLYKTGIILNKKSNPKKFFNDIQGFDDIKNKTELLTLQKSLKNELSVDSRNRISSKMGDIRRGLNSRTRHSKTKSTGNVKSVTVVNKTKGKKKITGKPYKAKKKKI